MHIPGENLALRLKGAQEGRITAIEAIKTHPGKTDPLLTGVEDHGQSQVGFALEAALSLGNARCLTARRITSPVFGQKQSFVYQRRVGAPAQRGNPSTWQFSTLPN